MILIGLKPQIKCVTDGTILHTVFFPYLLIFSLTENEVHDIMPFVPGYGLLAQLVEHIVHIDGVTGSSPVQTTRNKDHLRGDPFFVSSQRSYPMKMSS